MDKEDEKWKGGATAGIGSFSRGGPRRHMAIEEYAVDWNGPETTPPPPRLRLLLLADVDLASAGGVVEWAIQGGRAFDLCAVCGDFIPRPKGWSSTDETEEQLSAEEGEMSATLAQLENTVCRVVYVPGPLDPVMPSIRLSRRLRGGDRGATSLKEGGGARSGGGGGVPQLTPTSKNLYRRNLRLAPGLSTAGFTEELDQRVSERGGGGNGNGGGSSSSGSGGSGGSSSGGGGVGVRVRVRVGEGGEGAKDKSVIRGQTSATLRALCQSSGDRLPVTEGRASSSGNNIANSGNPPASSSASFLSSSPPRAPGASIVGTTRGRRKRAAQAQPPPPESLFLMTRLGGARGQGEDRARGAGAATSGPRAPEDDDDDDEEEEEENDNDNGAKSGCAPGSAADGAAASAEVAAAAAAAEDDETVTAGLLRQLWAREGVEEENSKATGGDGGGSNDREGAESGAKGESLQEEERTGVEESSRRRSGGRGRGGLLLHACSGPGALLAVRDALSPGGEGQRLHQQQQQQQQPPTGAVPLNTGEGSTRPEDTAVDVRETREGSGTGGDSITIADDEGDGGGDRAGRTHQEAIGAGGSRSRGGDGHDHNDAGGGGGGGVEGVGCRIGGCTIVALGSLRKHGAYCVVELTVPVSAETPWAVASVELGRIEGFQGKKETMRRSLARGTTEFVLNYDE